jgi:hypothetical protein
LDSQTSNPTFEIHNRITLSYQAVASPSTHKI